MSDRGDRESEVRGSGLLGWVRNVMRSSLLDVDFYNEAEADSSLDGQAAATVAIATGLAGVGSAIATEANVLIGAAFGLVVGLVGWLVWAGTALFVGTRIFDGTSDFGEMRRVLGFAFAPLAIGVIPWLGFVGAAWSLLAATIGIREGMDFDTPRAIVTVIAGWATWLGLSVLVQWVADVAITPSLPF